jgi:RimJ/RimL family protein N-acetyltransferase
MRETIDTPRLRLIPISDAEAEAILRGDLSAVDAGEGWPHEDTLDGLRLAPGWFVSLDGVVIGDCGTHGDADDEGRVEIGYGLAAPYRGRGYGTELVTALARWLLRQDGVSCVVAETDAGNAPSRRALERAGFRLARTVYELR